MNYKLKLSPFLLLISAAQHFTAAALHFALQRLSSSVQRQSANRPAALKRVALQMSKTAVQSAQPL
jgi:hypothetical protein